MQRLECVYIDLIICTWTSTSYSTTFLWELIVDWQRCCGQFYKIKSHSTCSTSRHFQIFSARIRPANCTLDQNGLKFSPFAQSLTLHNHPHTMSEGSVFLCWQELSLARQSPVDRRRGRDLKRSAQIDCLRHWLAAWWVNHSVGEGTVCYIFAYTWCPAEKRCLSETQTVYVKSSWDCFALTQEMAHYCCRFKQSSGCCNMCNNSCIVLFLTYNTCSLGHQLIWLKTVCLSVLIGVISSFPWNSTSTGF